jgi:hypothetical protein
MQLAQCLITNGNGHITFAGHLIGEGMPHCQVIDKVTTSNGPKMGIHYLSHTRMLVITAEHWNLTAGITPF